MTVSDGTRVRLTGPEREKAIRKAAYYREREGLRWQAVLSRVGVTHGEARFKQDVREYIHETVDKEMPLKYEQVSSHSHDNG